MESSDGFKSAELKGGNQNLAPFFNEKKTSDLLKNTRRLDYGSAHKTWSELLSNDLELVEHQINDAVA